MQQEFIINEEIIMNEILNDTILTDKCKELRSCPYRLKIKKTNFFYF